MKEITICMERDGTLAIRDANLPAWEILGLLQYALKITEAQISYSVANRLRELEAKETEERT